MVYCKSAWGLRRTECVCVGARFVCGSPGLNVTPKIVKPVLRKPQTLLQRVRLTIACVSMLLVGLLSLFRTDSGTRTLIHLSCDLLRWLNSLSNNTMRSGTHRIFPILSLSQTCAALSLCGTNPPNKMRYLIYCLMGQFGGRVKQQHARTVLHT